MQLQNQAKSFMSHIAMFPATVECSRVLARHPSNTEAQNGTCAIVQTRLLSEQTRCASSSKNRARRGERTETDKGAPLFMNQCKYKRVDTDWNISILMQKGSSSVRCAQVRLSRRVKWSRGIKLLPFSEQANVIDQSLSRVFSQCSKKHLHFHPAAMFTLGM